MVLEYVNKGLQKLNGPIEDFINHKNVMRTVMIVETIKVICIMLFSTYQDDDYYSYIEQAQTIREGNLNYDAISGRSGPVAYPALNSYLHLFYLNKYITDDGQYYTTARAICSLVHLITMYFIVRIYQLAFKDKPKLTNLVVLHCFSFISLQAFSEKIFNDSYVTLYTVIAIYLFQTQFVFLGCISVSLAIGFKANALIYLPAVYLLASKSRGIFIGTLYVMMTLALQVGYAYPFLSVYPQEYINRSYDFGRVYVHGHNFFWKFVPPFIIRLPVFNASLLLAQLGLLCFYLFSKWLKLKDCFSQLGIWPIKLFPKYAEQDSFYVAEVFFLCNFIGMVCARGIFFQYMTWFWFSVPFVLWSGPMKFRSYSVKELLAIF